jgi:hypothetical protein
MDRICQRSKLLEYCDFLQDAGISAETVKKRLLVLRHTLTWIRTLQLDPGSETYNQQWTRATQTEAVLTHLIKGYSRSHAASNSVNERSISALVRAGRWPKDGEVRRILQLNASLYAKKVAEVKKHGTVTTTNYNWCLSYIINALVINGPYAAHAQHSMDRATHLQCSAGYPLAHWSPALFRLRYKPSGRFPARAHSGYC